ncbi:tRNA (adenine(22)-N(1))-methyltransferase TrmK [Aliiglaciecola sp. CAU 1673]|uniref:tRNA (adenine(22)-N(1))-methyltransferase n=1 Tax=Aliiglaciecola sp. CAU 1673 TaxID=3032595 RepID=UPI0023DB2298|nr:tRNA (adenine(22)-N(1))-methyltransferase TrmK [Aliiglaciecola sp. CAU 1673]MDF2177271.1 tRNA (adenine(22)-N(1))-methyltransferase TrmK [Aliiglaciecola sp. CAU 1673]
MKLGQRLTQLEKMVTGPFDHIWDCCCDHGLLGASLLSRKVGKTVHFVDIVEKLIDEVNAKLLRFYPHGAWQTHCLDVSLLPLEKYQGKQLIIIAGVGGDLMMDFVSALVKNHRAAELEFLLCPVYHQYALRQRLIELELGLIDEVLVEDNQRFYEILHLSVYGEALANVHPVGDKLWQANSEEEALRAQRYLHKTLAHYQRIEKGGKVDVREEIAAYSAVCLDNG